MTPIRWLILFFAVFLFFGAVGVAAVLAGLLIMRRLNL